ncbi:endonuclease/exonuclease/phosphatase family protein, partial [Trifolium medium]|nr:endonuclease/exonuclease/phosphatase family protein [Trifolium medium]
ISRPSAKVRQASSEESTSSVTVNKDWEHWVALQGSEKTVVDDVLDIGKAIGVKFKGDNVNMFSVLSRGGKDKPTAS